MERTHLAVIVAAAIGICAGFVLASVMGTGGTNDGQIALVQPGSPGPADPSPAAATGQLVPGKGEAGAGVAVDPGAVPRSLLARAIAEIPSPPVASGDGRIGGRVRTVDGAPLAGVTVRAQKAKGGEDSSPWRYSGAPPPDQGVEEEVLQAAEAAVARRAGRKEASTGPDGAYALEGLADGRYLISAYKEGYRISAKGAAHDVKPGAELDFTAAALIELPVDVLLPDGGRPEKARIVVEKAQGRGPGRGPKETRPWTPASSVVWLEPGTIKLTAEVEGQSDLDAGYRSEGVEATIERGANPAPVTLQLKGAIGIRGKLSFPPGLAPDYVQVWAAQVPPGRPIDPKKPPGDRMQENASRTRGYAFVFKGLAPGAWMVATSYRWGQAASVSTTVQVSDGMAQADLVVPAPPPEMLVTVRAYAPDGAPVREIQIEIQTRVGRYSQSGSPATFPQEDGSVLVLLDDPKDDHDDAGDERKDGQRSLSVSSAKYGRKEAKLDPGRRDIDVRFSEPAFVEASVPGYSASEVAGRLALSLDPKMEKDGAIDYGRMWNETQRLQAAGTQKLGPVDPGQYDLVMRLYDQDPDQGFGAMPIKRVQMQLSSGTTKATIEIPALYRLTVVMDKAGVSRHVSLVSGGEEATQMPGMFHRYRQTKEKEVVFERLPAGSYVVHVHGGEGSGRMAVEVPAQSVVNFEPKPVNALRIRITNQQGRLAQAGFRTGDLMVGIEGVEFKNETHMQGLVFGAMSRESVKVTVLRGSEKLEMTLNAKDIFGEDGDGGADIEPDTRD